MLLTVLLFVVLVAGKGAFFRSENGHWVFGNDHWSVTQGPTHAKPLTYRGKELTGRGAGHYMGMNAKSTLKWTSAGIARKGTNFIDVKLTAAEGSLHWVIFDDLHGAYQYFVNGGLPALGEFRGLWRLDNRTFTHGATAGKEGALPRLPDYARAKKVQDETWEKADGSYITKYDWAGFLREQDVFGVYGEGVGSWFIHAGKDYFNGNHLKQELMIHRESNSGDTVQLNMIHGTHFQATTSDNFPKGKTWGPWLWYLNSGSRADATARAKKELASWPYTWHTDAAYQARGTVRGILTLSDGRPAAGAAVFLGDDRPKQTALGMGSNYYYTGYADATGAFEFKHVRVGTYGLQAWANGGKIGDVPGAIELDSVSVAAGKVTDLGSRVWKVRGKGTVFRVGEFDRKAVGFRYAGGPYQHGLSAKCPATLTWTAGTSKASDWCFAQAAPGSWKVVFEIGDRPANATGAAVLTVSLAGYSGSATTVLVNGKTVGGFSNKNLSSDPGTYRSATTAGEWHQMEYKLEAGALRRGQNVVEFKMTEATRWHGVMWDAVMLEWL
ncbi:hypothetical protein EJ06DRAFT_543690 [Trichodelitschia bisporula]|uniref:rhamnogalacturonan endolyase n=1 Tax=Trichodelitschia bisporula TaxID=703511 RepID=A0A6G1HT49_9PEZI|nr:hypothetical protein EJ06DRAFT_543690 [Trichodelitschia bisporula]